jgi:long-chain acyl-CoA synthetase
VCKNALFICFERYKLQNGKFVVPSQLEAAIGRSRFIEQCLVHGENLPGNVAIIVPNWPNVSASIFFSLFFILFQVLDRLALPASASREELSSDRSVHKLLLDEVSRECVGQKHYAIPHKIIVSPTNFTVENGMATQKMSLKRKNIVHTFQNRINEIKF